MRGALDWRHVGVRGTQVVRRGRRHGLLAGMQLLLLLLLLLRLLLLLMLQLLLAVPLAKALVLSFEILLAGHPSLEGVHGSGHGIVDNCGFVAGRSLAAVPSGGGRNHVFKIGM